MAPTTERPLAPRLSLAEVDEALRWSVARPERDKLWRAWVDSLLDTRNRITTLQEIVRP